MPHVQRWAGRSARRAVETAESFFRVGAADRDVENTRDPVQTAATRGFSQCIRPESSLVKLLLRMHWVPPYSAREVIPNALPISRLLKVFLVLF